MTDESRSEAQNGSVARPLSRRRLLASGAFFLGGAGALGTDTAALFTDSESASGTVQIDAPSQLNYDIVDNTDNLRGNKASYTIHYQVEWLADFSSLQLTVDNLTDGTTPLQNSSSNTEDSFSFQENGGAGDDYEFTFTIYASGSQHDQQSVTDTAGGSGPSQGDMGSVDSPTLDSFYVTDRTSGNKASFTIDPTISNTSKFGQFEVFFDNRSGKDQADATATNTDPNGTVDYDSKQGNTAGHQYEITVDVYNSSGVVTDSGSLLITAGSGDKQWP